MVLLITYVNEIVFLCRTSRRYMRHKRVACILTVRQVIDKEDEKCI